MTTARVRNGKVRIPHQYGYRFRLVRFAVVLFCMLFLLHHFYPGFNVPVVPGISCASGVRDALPDEGFAPAGGVEGGAYATGKALRDLSEGPPNPDDVKDTLLSGAVVAGKFAGGVRAAWDGAAAPLKTPEPAPVEGSGTTDVAAGGPCSPCGGVDAIPASGPALPGLTGEQSRNAYVIMRTGQGMRVHTKGLVVALAAASQESGLRNLRYGMQDSQGLFQMRPSMGWGTVAQVTDPGYAARKFFTVLRGVRGWQGMSVTEAAQAVERSGSPGAYAKWEPRAWSVVRAAAGSSKVRAAAYVATGAANGSVLVDGKRVSAIAARQLALAERLSGIDMHVMQGGYGGDHIAASGTSHNYPGVMDVSPGTIEVETWLRRVDFAAWARNIPGRSHAGSGAHVHAASLLDPGDKASPQVYGSWAHHGNGLSGANNDPAAHVALVPGLSKTGDCATTARPAAVRGAGFTLATFNVLGASHTGIPSAVRRMHHTVAALNAHRVDVVGLQEFQGTQAREFHRLTAGTYTRWGAPGDPQNSVAWRTSRFQLLGTRLVPVPYFDGHTRLMPAVHLQHAGGRLWVLNVHNPADTRRFPRQAANRAHAVRAERAALGVLRATGDPAYMTGDMNARAAFGAPMHADGMISATGYNYRGIDWILGSPGTRFTRTRVDDSRGVDAASDHPLVVTRVPGASATAAEGQAR